jgi:ferredoxin
VTQYRDGSRGGRRPRRQAELRVNPIACEAHGMCIELLPELISADPWGYPIVAPGPVPPRLMGLARRAVSDCPTLALLLTAPRDAGRARPAAER